MRKNKISFGRAVSLRVKELMTQHKLTQNQFSIETGVPVSTLCELLNVKHENIIPTSIIAICKYFKMELSEFFDSPYFYIDFLQIKY